MPPHLISVSILIFIADFFYLFLNNKRIKTATLILVYTIVLNIFVTGIISGYEHSGDVKVVRDLITLNIMVLITAFMVDRKHTIMLTVFLIASYFVMAFVFNISLYADFLIFMSLFTIAALFIYSMLANLIEKTVKASMDAKSEVEHLGKFKHTITRLVFHDIKVPVNSIIDINKDDNTSKAKKTVFYATSIKKQLENVLDVERLEEAEIKPEYSDVNISDIVSQAVVAIDVLASQKNISIETEISCGGILNCDKNLIERVLVNLLSNAVKYSPANKTIFVQALQEGDNCVFKVIDEGIGISEDHVDKIFNKYFMVNPDMSSRGASTGLGLTFCKLAVSAHSGSIEVLSNENSGSVFIVKLPGYQQITVTSTIHSFKDDTIKLNSAQIHLLNPVCEIVKDIPLFKIGEIIPHIKPLEKSLDEDVRLWAQKVSDAVYSGNEQFFKQLTGNISEYLTQNE
jgi:signal transduction histidine kinase